MPISPDIERAIEGRRDELLNTLFRLLRQPSISTQGVGVVECAELVKTILEEHGISGRVMPTAGLPVVYEEWSAGLDANTILIYGHYDVQPPEPYEAWISPPFEPAVRDGRIYARGAGDNKGQFLEHILAIKVLADLGKLPRLNIKLLLEGEEESSSPNYLFTNVLKMPAIWATYGPHDQNNHSPNENITVKSFFDGIRASALVLQRFAAMPRSDASRGPQNTVT